MSFYRKARFMFRKRTEPKYKFSKNSMRRLESCNDNLKKLFCEVIKHRDCTILEGHRGQSRQDEFYDKGKSKIKWPNGKHNSYPSDAVDVMPYPINWENLDALQEFAVFVIQTAKKMGIRVQWGGNWHSFIDMPHWEIIDG